VAAVGRQLPNLTLLDTDGGTVDLPALAADRALLLVYVRHFG